MSLALRLRAALLALALLLTAVVGVQLAVLNEATASQRTIVALTERLRIAATLQPSLLDELRRSARKFVITRDTGYLRQVSLLKSAFDSSMTQIGASGLSIAEASAVAELHAQWRAMSDVREVIAAGVTAGAATRAAMRADTIAGDVLAATNRLADATRTALAGQAARSERRARVATRVSLGVASAALVLALLLSVLLVRSIVRPLERLEAGAKAVAAGRLDYRVPDTGPDELARLSRDFNVMTARLAEVDRMKRDFLSNVSHDLKTPLSLMQETTDALLDGLAGPLTDKQRQLLTYHRDGGLRLSSMLGKLLDLSRLEGRPSARHELLELTGLVRRAVDHARSAREGRSGLPSVEFVGDDTRLALRADAEGIAQVLDNLLENALKFSPADGIVRVGLRHDRGDAVLTVEDEGPGVPDGEKARIFERFHQTSVGRAVASRGVGLGLAICRHVAHAHGGQISVRDNTPCGAVFEVRLPHALEIGAVQDDVAGIREGATA